ncbi:MAG: hypothetical protein HY785_13625 [Oscillatoriophycideae cyanobacterium NC_groundwater_1537_Pr4_S-0.65um_50_18]|nr:hypothetical protein [Oscillatoriophycideae cyanobacterium NC_groundwater_1537_Pr4_S-0.65um_50_18]
MRQVLRQASWTAMTLGLALATGGCGLLGGGDSFTTASPSETLPPVAVSPDAVGASPTTAPGQPGDPSFPNPTVSPQSTSPKGILPPDLISSTDPNQRVRQVQSSRADPFALLPTAPTVELPPPPPPSPVAVAPAARAAANPFPTSRPGTAGASGRSSSGQGSGSGGALAPVPNLVPRTPAARIAPPPPQPDLARAVQVTGVVQVGETLYAIVNAPNEPTSRYVQAGQRLSNGQILVRRIDATGAEPKVVFEQFGIEVVRAVGEGGAPSPVPAAAVPAIATQG